MKTGDSLSGVRYIVLEVFFHNFTLECRSKLIIFVFSDIVVYGTTSATKGVVYDTPEDKTWGKSCLAT